MKGNTKGITLIALIISVIIIMILGTITMDAVLDENGFLYKSRELKENGTTQETEQKNDLDVVTDQFEDEKNDYDEYTGKNTPDANYQIERYNILELAYANTLEEAYKLADSGTIITALKDVTDDSTLEINKDIILDTNGRTITITNPINILENSYGTLTIKGNGKILNNTNGIIEHKGNGEVVIEEGRLEAQNNTINIVNNGTVRIKNGKITATNNVAINNQNAGKIILEEGNINSPRNVLLNLTSGTIEINGGTITGGNYSVENGSTYALVTNCSNGRIDINNGEITANSNYALWNQSTGNITINGGKIDALTNLAVYNASTGEIKINDGEVLTEANNKYAIENGSTGIITIGDNTKPINDSSPSIYGNIAVSNRTGTFNFYNGILRGITTAYDENSITNQRTDATLKSGVGTTSTGISYKTAYYE